MSKYISVHRCITPRLKKQLVLCITRVMAYFAICKEEFSKPTFNDISKGLWTPTKANIAYIEEQYEGMYDIVHYIQGRYDIPRRQYEAVMSYLRVIEKEADGEIRGFTITENIAEILAQLLIRR